MTVGARGIAGWLDTESVNEKLRILEERTRRLHDEVGELQTDLRDTERRLGREHAEAVEALRTEDREIREALQAYQQESVRSDASALPVIVMGVVLGGLADDASEFQIWAWLLFLGAICGYAVCRSWLIWRDQ